MEKNKEELMNYLMLHRNHSVSLKDIEKGTGLEKKVILKFLNDLSSQGMINYQINLINKKSQDYLKKYGNKIADSFEDILGQN